MELYVSLDNGSVVVQPNEKSLLQAELKDKPALPKPASAHTRQERVSVMDLIRFFFDFLGEISQEVGFNVSLTDPEWQALRCIADQFSPQESTMTNLGQLFTIVEAETDKNKQFWEHGKLPLPATAGVIDLTPIKGIMFSVCYRLRRARLQLKLN